MACIIWTRGQEIQDWQEVIFGGLTTVMEERHWKGVSRGLSFSRKSTFSIGTQSMLGGTGAWPVLARVGKHGLTEDSSGTGESIPGPIGASSPDDQSIFGITLVDDMYTSAWGNFAATPRIGRTGALLRLDPQTAAVLKCSFIIITAIGGGGGIVIKVFTTTSRPINIAVLIYHFAIFSTIIARLMTVGGIYLHEDVSILYIRSLFPSLSTITYWLTKYFNRPTDWAAYKGRLLLKRVPFTGFS